ncbi:hypothetical protein Adeh_3047 [Anaeromyxobacter dehalogenans 2CP-C]|uniref:Uncharacterized protein n=1 Tax=Anaeromyxobacter dehalogenans (strain 2CP-C) TaxID=290397 RepID=Q2IE07_ANADE|nr:hypothetical protein Adeh_3047 [Anaeromyxobacter dehalogenans 2CP-C]
MRFAARLPRARGTHFLVVPTGRTRPRAAGRRAPLQCAPSVISLDLSAFLESGVSILLASRDARLLPDCVRAVGARVEAGGAELTVLVPEASAGRCPGALRESGRVAVMFSRPTDHQSIQVKGQVAALAPATAEERALVERYTCALARELALVGVPPRLTLRVNRWPCLAVRLRVDGLFVQTPGPGAGAPLGSAVPPERAP